MRVISGYARGRKLKTVSGSIVRPTADRVKEAMFNILVGRLIEARVLDLFAGSGALGIEAVSRGAQSAVFVDNSRKALAAVRQNVENCRLGDKATIIGWDIKKNLNCLAQRAMTFDLVFMDPPYHQGLVDRSINHLIHSDCLAPGGTIVAEHETGLQFDLGALPITQTDSRRYGSNHLTFFEFEPADSLEFE